jgi:hypothetical protein
VSLVDILPTILDLWQQPAPDYFDGMSLLRSVPEDRWVACFTNAPWTRWLMNGFAVIDDDYFVYAREDFGEPQVFDARNADAIRYQLRGTAYEGEAKERFRSHIESSELLKKYQGYLME